jgi:general secretion pathway protein B
MSYILDALRRAESERDRGAVPSIHAQPMPMPALGAAPGRSALVPWVVAGAALLVVALLGWRLIDSRKAVAPIAMNSPAPATITQAPPTTAANVQPMPTTAAPPASSALAAPASVARPAQRPASPPPARTVKPIEKPAARADTRADATETESAPAATPPAVTRVPTAAQGVVYNRNDLPADVQRQLPNLAIGGSTFSHEAASRMLIINGQVFHEGDPLGPELTLEQIQLKAAVFRFKGYRYRVTF